MQLNLDTVTDINQHHLNNDNNNNNNNNNNADVSKPNPFTDYHAASAGETTETSDTTTNDYYSSHDDSDTSTDTTYDSTRDTDNTTSTDTDNTTDDETETSTDHSHAETTPTHAEPTPTHPVNSVRDKHTTETTRDSVVAAANRAPVRRRLSRKCKQNTDFSKFF